MEHVEELHVLEHLGFVLECLAEDVRGEAKSELGSLARALESDKRYAIAGAQERAHKLSEALMLLRGDDARGAAAILARVSRELWKRVLSG